LSSVVSVNMFNVIALFVFAAALYGSGSAQESVNAHEGFDVGMHAAISLTICFVILTTFAITINLIKKKCVKVVP